MVGKKKIRQDRRGTPLACPFANEREPTASAIGPQGVLRQQVVAVVASGRG